MTTSAMLDECLLQVGNGSSSFAGVHKIANAAVLEGIPSAGVQTFASLGAHGECPQNVERDAHRWLRNYNGYNMQTYTIKLKVCAAKGGVEEISVPVLSVHQMLSNIWHSGMHQRYVSLLGPKGARELGEFWEHLRELAWGHDHPALHDPEDFKRTMGLVFHCDGVEVLHV